jgi:hypothetical protein
VQGLTLAHAEASSPAVMNEQSEDFGPYIRCQPYVERADGQVNFYKSSGEARSRASNHFPIVGESVLRFALPNCEETAPQSCPGLPLMVINGAQR